MPAPTAYRDEATPGGHASPGVGGAIKDAVSAVATTFGPKAITQARPRQASQISANDGSNGPGNEDTRISGNTVSP